ncbi:MAG TPA: YeeE/YedE family protein, partial [Rhodobacteraceae bacterium]|nr:YeeE/YedE family protein [Paracoccaceae bacterium]
MFESLGFENLTPGQAAIWFGLMIGAMFGALAQVTRFCFRSAILGGWRNEAAGVWIMALITATIGTQAAVRLEII